MLFTDILDCLSLKVHQIVFQITDTKMVTNWAEFPFDMTWCGYLVGNSCHEWSPPPHVNSSWIVEIVVIPD